MVVTFLLTAVHVLVALFLIAVVLLQTGKRADLAGAFGGGGSQTAFGTRGAATLLSKATTTSAVIFMLTSLALSILASKGSTESGSVLPDDQLPAQTQPAPTEQIPQDLPPVPAADTPAADPAAGSDSVPGSEPPPAEPN